MHTRLEITEQIRKTSKATLPYLMAGLRKLINNRGEIVDVPENIEGLDISDWFNNRNSRIERRLAYIDWISNAKKWLNFNTLTVDPERFPDISQESLIKKIYQLFHEMNKNLLGKNFKSICGEYYFSWVFAVEPHKSGNLHAHFMADRPINEDMINIFWNRICGFALVKKIDDLEGAILYTTKDIVKGGVVDQYFRKAEIFEPLIKPYWWDIS